MAGSYPNPKSATDRVGLLSQLLRNGELAWRLLKDPRVSRLSKIALPALAGLYFLSPIDLLPDVFPLLTQVDDIAVLALALKFFIDLAPPAVVAEHLQSMRGGGGPGHKTVDADYRVVE